MSNEEALLKAAKAFDQTALAQIYDEYSPALYRYAMRQTGIEEQAEECVAETFSRLLRALHAGKGPKSHMKAYLYRIAQNWITDYFRSPDSKSVELKEDVTSQKNYDAPDDWAEIQFETERVRRALGMLPEKQRQVIVLKFLEEWNNADIAVVLEKKVGAVKALQSRGLATLRQVLATNEMKHETTT
ncbi:MAG: sigma-70 family RNA polymerase sigma factor [Chloroflexi bacterium]|nr:sigma-70 family RNA polymerase sigma factor [Chloroflexota bacterium]